MAFTPLDPTKAEVRVVGEAPNQALDIYIPRGAKGEPGGITLGALLATGTNLDQVLTSGLYRQTDPSYATLLNNYPKAALAGVLRVYERATGFVVQEYEGFTAGQEARVYYKRDHVGNWWTPWRVYASQRVSESAGRAIYTWDDLNSREQITYGDTGWRRITVPVVAGKVTGGTALIRRKGSNVYLRFDGVTMDTAQTSYCTLLLATDIQSGFRASAVSPERTQQSIGGNTNALDQNIITNFYEIGWARVISGTTISTVRPAYPLAGTIQWVTDDAWPTTLPGTAVGTIQSS